MGTFQYAPGLKVRIDDRNYVFSRKVDDSLWQLSDAQTLRVYEYSIDQLNTLYVDQDLKVIPEDSAFQTPLPIARKVELPEKLTEAIKVRRYYVKAIETLPKTQSQLKPAIDKVWQEIQKPAKPPSPSTVCRWRARYESAGKDIYALVPEFHKRGNHTERYSKAIAETVEETIERIYLKPERRTMKDTWDVARAVIARENKVRLDSEQLPIPGYRYIKRHIAKVPDFDRYAARYGYMAAQRRHRGSLGHHVVEAPLVRAEIDHTLLDLFVIDEESGLPLGRPWVTVCTDSYSRSVLGLVIGFTPPSYLSVADCLRHAVMPKTGLRDRYPALKNDWHAYGIMGVLVVDNGMEFHSDSLEMACHSMNIDIQYTPRKSPWFKGKIERFIGTFNRNIAHGIPGTTFSNIFEKGEYNPSKHAMVTLSTLRELSTRWVCDVYHQQPHRALQEPPVAFWTSGISPEDILFPDSIDELNALLGRAEGRVLSRKGIELDGLTYNSPDMLKLLTKYGPKLDVSIRVDDRDIGEIIVISPKEENQYFKVPARNLDYAKGLTAWQHKMIQAYAREKLKSYDPKDWLEAKLQLIEEIENRYLDRKRKSRKGEARFKESKEGTQRSSKKKEKPTPEPQADPKPEAAPTANAFGSSSTTETEPTRSSDYVKPVHFGFEKSQRIINERVNDEDANKRKNPDAD